MKKYILVASGIMLSYGGFAQKEKMEAAVATIDTMIVPLEGKGETPKALEGTWVLQSGIKMKEKSEVMMEKRTAPGAELNMQPAAAEIAMSGEKSADIKEKVATEEKSAADPGIQITPQQGERLHYPEKPGISFYGKNETFTGFSGCNKFSGKYRVKENSIAMETGASTQMACIGQFDEKEFMSKLKKINQYKVNDDKLELMVDNEVLLVFSRK